MILLYVGLLMPLTVFLYAGFIRALPREYEEAAQVDGAGPCGRFVRVVFPLLRPVTGTVAILDRAHRLERLLPAADLPGRQQEPDAAGRRLPVRRRVRSRNGTSSSPPSRSRSLPIIVFYLFAQKQLIRGFTGGIRG